MVSSSPRAESAHPDSPLTGRVGVRFIPLGGLGEIGMNCFALEQDGQVLVVDCGVTFPEDDVGVDVVHPDFAWLVARRQQICGIFITHGHEDHIGALPYLLEALGRAPEVFAPAHACALLASRLKERGLSSACLHEVAPGETYRVGPFSVEPVAVAHSIVDATALCIETAAGRLLHTGDFDFDEWQPTGHVTDEQRLLELGDAGVRLLLSDSTNVDREQREGSEEDVALALRRVVSAAQERVVVGMFSSNVHRLAALGDIARETGRRLCLLGRSLTRQVETALAIGRLKYPSDLLVAASEVGQLPRRHVLVLAGGSQGERPSSLRRLSVAEHRLLSLEAGDEVVLSSRVIPGNERAVLHMQNDFLRMGIVVRSRMTDPDLHTSGHAARSEQRRMLQLLRPAAFVPVHGTLHHLTRHKELALSEGALDALVVENGTPVWIPRHGKLEAEARVPHGQVRIAVGGLPLDAETRRRRLELARNGVVTIALALDQTGQLACAPAVASRGIPGVDGELGAYERLTSSVRAAVGAQVGVRSIPLEETIRRAARRTVQDLSGVRAVVEVTILRTFPGAPSD